MRALLPPDVDISDEGGLYAAYAPPRADWVRANFISSVDGAVSLNGTAGGLGTPADQEVLAILRAHADVVVAGAATIRAEDYGPVRHTPARTALRTAAGRTGPARLAVVSRALVFTGEERWIREAPVPPLLLTGAENARDIPGAETVVCGTTGVEPGRALDALHERNLFSILYEGGPLVFANFAGQGRLDELCLTISPTLAGPGASRIVAGVPWADARRGRLTQVLEDDGLLFARYAFTG
jgi:riboflavin biosynthesis pyrimidine reductase